MNGGLFVCLLEDSFLSDSESRRVKIVNMIQETSKESREESNFDKREGRNEMRVRDGMLSVDPLISLTTHESQSLHSKFIRIEFWEGPIMLFFDFETTTNTSQVKPQFDSYGQRDHSVTEMIYYALFAFTIASFIGGFIFVCICLNQDRRRARKERHKRRQERLERQQEEGSCVRASEESSSEEEEGDPFRPDRPEISQIVLEGDGVSLEMDYYDYYHNELIAKKEKKQEDSEEPTSAVTSFQS